ncbi:MAG: response regulator transcription factor [Tannerellaceae bacterium]|jgi:DNA-binding NarL/FixJ family response regulator|nr:response regulator transcription factor [Tannerellaceae bacterium]
MRTIILADNQDITKTGISYLCSRLPGVRSMQQAGNKKALIRLLSTSPDAVVILDYTLFDLSGVEELLILNDRFHPDWVLFSEDLSADFVQRVSSNNESFSIILKDCSLEEIETALRLAVLRSERYLCQRVTNLLVSRKRNPAESDDRPILTSTEWEILKLIALGKTTKEIAEERFSSTHTITTHRKNIFRKLDVNNVHEATKYALRAGIVDLAEYYI